MADLGEAPGGPAPSPPPLFWVKKEEMTEVKKVSRASKSRPGSATGLYTVSECSEVFWFPILASSEENENSVSYTKDRAEYCIYSNSSWRGKIKLGLSAWLG